MPIMGRCTITNNSFRGSPGCNEALQSLEEGPIGSDMLRMNQVRFSADENVSTVESSIDGRGIGLDFVHKKIIIKSRYIHSRMRGAEPLEQIAML